MNTIVKIFKFLLNTLFSLIIAVGVIFIFLYVIGIEPFVVESGSMEPEIKTGSVSFINKKEKYENIKENDIIAFQIPSNAKVTHRVIAITEDGMETKGDANDFSDGISTTKENFIGKSVFNIPKVGYVIKAIQSKRGKIILGTVVVVLVISAFLIGEPSSSKKKKEEKNKEEKE